MITSSRNIALLIAAQVLSQTATIAMVAISALVGFDLANDKALATLPIALGMVVGAALMIPASLFMRRFGRRAGFVAGAMMGVVSGLLAMVAIWQHSFVLFAAASAVAGAYQAFAQFYRFAAMEAVNAVYRARAVSWVVAGGIVAAFAGPALARAAGSGRSDAYTGMFAVVTALALLAIVVVALLRLPPPALPEAGTLARPVAVLIAQPVFLAALAASVAGYGVMSIIMSATPLAMQLCGLSRASSSDVIQWHMLGMFAPSLFAGDVLRRIGMVRFLSCGTLLMGGAILAALNGQDLAHFYIALTLLGVGWTFLFIGGSTLLAQAWRPGEQAKVQAAHDFVVFGVASCGTFFSGRVLTGRGWSSVNTLTLPLLLLAAVMIVVHWRRTRVAAYA